MAITLVNDAPPRSQFEGNGVQTAFFCEWPLRSGDHLYLVFNEGETPDIAYSLAGVNTDSGFTITFDSPPPAGTLITAERRAPYERQTNYGQQKAFQAQTVNAEFADLVMQVQQVNDRLRRAVIVEAFDTAPTLMLPPVSQRANSYLRFDANGAPTSVSAEVSEVYYGAFASDPTSRPDGSARQEGDLYFNTVLQGIKVYTADGWVVATFTYETADAVQFTPSGGLTAQNVQGALAELDSKKVARAGDTMSGDLVVAHGGQPGVAMRHPGDDPDSEAKVWRPNEGHLEMTATKAADYAEIGLSPKPLDETSNAFVRLFRNTITSGLKRFVVHKGDGTGDIAAEARVNAAGDGLDVIGKVNFGTAPTVGGVAIGGGAPTGSVIAFAGSTAPGGWLFCDGREVSRTTYAALFAAIGTIHGSGNGSTTFNLPDLRGRTVAGRDDMGGASAGRLTSSGTGNPGIDGTQLGASGGTDRHTLTTGQMPSHSHNTRAYTGASGSTNVAEVTGTSSSSSVTLSPSTTSAGSSQAHPNVQPTLVLNYIIKT